MVWRPVRPPGRTHPAFEIEELAKSLPFPLDFTGITFGDNDGWGPTGFFFLMAKRLEQKEAALRAATYLRIRPRRRKERGRTDRTATGDVLYAAAAVPTQEIGRAHV